MTGRVLNNKVKKLKALQEQAAEIEKSIKELETVIKDEMTAREVEELKSGDYTVRYKTVESNRFDSKTFKTAYASLYNQYMKVSTVRRFTVV